MLVKATGYIPSGNVNKLEINGELMFVQAVYKKVEKATVIKNKNSTDKNTDLVEVNPEISKHLTKE